MIMEGVQGFQFGCDPELFILDAKGKPVTAEGIIPGTKAEPHAVKIGDLTVHVQVDGMAAEFNTPPAATFPAFNKGIDAAIKAIESFLPEGYTTSVVPAITFGKREFESAPDKAKELGCTPDFNAWTGEVNPPPHDPENPYLRTASGHLHIGWTEDADLCEAQHIMNCQDLTKQFDWYLGAYSVSVDTDPTRRRLYGRAGAFRPKPYGVEYRVLSNFWITTRERRAAVWNRMQLAINDMRSRFFPDKAGPGSNELICEYINLAKRNKALETNYAYPITTIDQNFSRF